MITCQERVTITNKGFLKCTSAERLAVSEHLNSCKDCISKIRNAAAEAKKNVSPEMMNQIEKVVEVVHCVDRLR